MGSNDWCDKAIAAAIAHTRRIARTATEFPHITENGVWQFTPDGVWTGGFWAGLLWLCHEHDQDAESLALASRFTDRLLPRANDSQNHDLGFMFMPSAVQGWQLTGNAAYHAAAISAANALASQFNPRGGFIPGWGFFGSEDWSGSVLIDTLMNLPLLIWAAEQTAKPQLIKVVEAHTAKTLAHHIRDDGSVFHVFKFDPESGRPCHGDTYQGLSSDSSWSRGQSWAITGFAILAAMTGKRTYLAASERVAAYFLAQMPTDGVPPWDFTATGANVPKDSSAGAIASYGFQKLHKLTGARKYLDAATSLLKALTTTCQNTSETGGLLLHSTADLPHGLGVDQSTIYGDYYFLKSLMAHRRRETNSQQVAQSSAERGRASVAD